MACAANSTVESAIMRKALGAPDGRGPSVSCIAYHRLQSLTFLHRSPSLLRPNAMQIAAPPPRHGEHSLVILHE